MCVCVKKRPLAFPRGFNQEKTIPETGGGAIVVQGATGEHKEKPGWRGEGGGASRKARLA